MGMLRPISSGLLGGSSTKEAISSAEEELKWLRPIIFDKRGSNHNK